MLSILGAIVLAGVLVLLSFIGLQQEHLTQQQMAATATAQHAATSIFLQQHDATMTSDSGTPHAHNITTGMPYVQGTQILDGAGHPIRLRGAQIESAFNNIKSWQAGLRLATPLNSSVFTAMAQNWNMNALRLPLSNWIYASNPTLYLSMLDQVIQEANTAGLYVVLDLHDDGKAGSPYGDNANLPKVEDVSFWKDIAAHYKNNPLVMFDLYNEPDELSWTTWLHGGIVVGGANTVGFQDLISAVRGTGAKQIIVVEPGSSGGNNQGWKTYPSDSLTDANIVYSLHVYQNVTFSAQQLDTLWGPILYHHPIYYGEWALLPNGYGQPGKDFCKNIVHAQADQVVINFMSYMDSRSANFTAWAFTPYHLIQDYTTFAPTTLDISWVCGDPTGHAGMGTIVKQHMIGQ